MISRQTAAHHATATEYEVSKTVALKGTIARVDWANPHIHVLLEVKSNRDVVRLWDVEFPAPGAAIVAGLSKEVLARGVVLSFEGYPGKLDFHPPRRGISSEGITKSADRFASATAVILPDGRRVTFVVGV